MFRPLQQYSPKACLNGVDATAISIILGRWAALLREI
jgi:hypothetical protein